MKFVGLPVNTMLRKKKEAKIEEQYLHIGLDGLEMKLGTASGNNADNEYYKCKERILEIEKVKSKGAIIRSKVKFLGEGERGR